MNNITANLLTQQKCHMSYVKGNLRPCWGPTMLKAHLHYIMWWLELVGSIQFHSFKIISECSYLCTFFNLGSIWKSLSISISSIEKHTLD